jgi:transcriptional regulator with XRE-family HTH domain
MTTYRKFDAVLARSLEDPEVRAEWDRTALARELSIWLIRYRQQHGLTQTALAELLGWRQPMVARLERAEHEPSIATLQYLGAQLGLRTKIEINGNEVRVHLLDGAPLVQIGVGELAPARPARKTGATSGRRRRAAPAQSRTPQSV